MSGGNKMKKLIMTIVIGLLYAVAFVSADAYLNVDVDTSEDLYAGFDLDAEGDITVWIDGYNLDDRVNYKISKINTGGGLSMRGVYGNLARVYTNKISTHDATKINYKQVMDAYFMPRQEIYSTFNPKLDKLRLETLLIYELFTDEEICAARMRVGEKYDFSEVQCNGVTWHKLPSGFVKITGTPTPVAEQEKKIETGWDIPSAWDPETKETTIEWHQRLCDRGFKNHCRKLEE